MTLSGIFQLWSWWDWRSHVCCSDLNPGTGALHSRISLYCVAPFFFGSQPAQHLIRRNCRIGFDFATGGLTEALQVWTLIVILWLDLTAFFFFFLQSMGSAVILDSSIHATSMALHVSDNPIAFSPFSMSGFLDVYRTTILIVRVNCFAQCWSQRLPPRFSWWFRNPATRGTESRRICHGKHVQWWGIVNTRIIHRRTLP